MFYVLIDTDRFVSLAACHIPQEIISVSGSVVIDTVADREVGDKLKEKGKKPNYTMIAIKGLLLRYKATNATVTVDGVSRHYKRVWIAPTMNGRFYGGGMMPTPDQNRNDRTKGVSVMLMHKAGRLRTLCIFPSIFKGKHIKHRKVVDVIQGHSITVEFDRPVALQIDGETVLNVSKYQVQSGAY